MDDIEITEEEIFKIKKWLWPDDHGIRPDPRGGKGMAMILGRLRELGYGYDLSGNSTGVYCVIYKSGLVVSILERHFETGPLAVLNTTQSLMKKVT